MKTRFLFSILGAAALLLVAGTASASPQYAPAGTAFTFQGRLTDGGAPASGAYDFEFSLYNAESGGSQVGVTITQDDVTVTGGLFTVQLDFGDVFDGTALYLEIAVRPGSETGDYTTLSPRQPLTAAPYALYAEKSPWAGLTGMPAGFADGVDNNTTYTAGTGLALVGSEFRVDTTAIQKRVGGTCAAGNAIRAIDANGNVTCESVVSAVGDITAVIAGTGLTGGATSGDATLAVLFGGTGGANRAARSDHDHWGQTWTGSGTGLTLSGGSIGLTASGSNVGLYGMGGTGGDGVYGSGVAGVYGSGSTEGVYGIGTTYGVSAYSSSGKGVYGNSISGTGVYGNSSSATGVRGDGGVYGVYGYSPSSTGVYGDGPTYGVYGASANIGVYGDGTSGITGVYGSGPYGVYGNGTNYGVYAYSYGGTGVDGTGGTYGLHGTSNSSTTGAGVYGDGGLYGVYGTSGVGDGVHGSSVANTAAGVSGEGVTGVYGKALWNGAGAGVEGTTATGSGDYAGLFYGNVRIVGNQVVTGSKSAAADTQDYGTRALYSVESPESWFEDFGTGQLVNGAAVITIEPIFAETVNLTEDYHVFVTPLADCALYVTDKSPTSFSVRAMGGQTCSTAFDYRIVAKRLGYEDKRLAEVNTPAINPPAVEPH